VPNAGWIARISEEAGWKLRIALERRVYRRLGGLFRIPIWLATKSRQVERFAPAPGAIRSTPWGKSLHPPGDVARGLTAGRLEQLPHKPNAVRRGVNRQQTRRPAWFARGLTAGRLSLATHSSARNRCEPCQFDQ